MESALPKYSFAFQPIVSAAERKVVSYEALVRGINNESASQVFRQLKAEDLYRFDEESRAVAVELAASLSLPCDLNLNFLPLSLEASQTAILSTLQAAERCGIPADRIVLEITENEMIQKFSSFIAAVNKHRSSGLKIAIDDFGAGYAGLNLLAEFQPDILKIDINLCRNIESNGPRQAIIRGIIHTCSDLGIDVIAEGIETPEEFAWFNEEGIDFFQGYLFAKPGFNMLSSATFPG